jgi:hypothetical protein
MGIILSPNEAPRRKRAGYQNGIESDLYLGENAVSPPTPLPQVYPTANGWGIKNHNKTPPLPVYFGHISCKKTTVLYGMGRLFGF